MYASKSLFMEPSFVCTNTRSCGARLQHRVGLILFLFNACAAYSHSHSTVCRVFFDTLTWPDIPLITSASN